MCISLFSYPSKFIDSNKKRKIKLCSSKESSLKDLQELAAQIFNKTNSAEETHRNAEPDNRKKQPNKDLHSNSSLSPLARFLLSRFVEFTRT